VIVARGGKVSEFKGGKVGKDLIASMLGPTGNLRAPTIRKGRTVVRRRGRLLERERRHRGRLAES
jgi:hypothetical protein